MLALFCFCSFLLFSFVLFFIFAFFFFPVQLTSATVVFEAPVVVKQRSQGFFKKKFFFFIINWVSIESNGFDLMPSGFRRYYRVLLGFVTELGWFLLG